MFKKIIIMAAGVFFILPATFSQILPGTTPYFSDALRFSQFQPTGTARYMGMGGVNNALGGDLSSLFGNPAGLGVYNKSELGMTMGLGFSSPTSTYFGTSLKDNRSYFTIPNIGVVFSSDRNQKRSGSFRGGSFGIGYSRIANFQNRYSYSGVNTQNSMTDYFAEIPNVNNINESYYQGLDYTTDLYNLDEQAYYNFLINPDPYGNNFRSWNGNNSNRQEETVTTKGAIKQWNFTYGANFSDKFFIGASLGIPTLRYEEDKIYKESPIGNDTLNYFTTGQSLLVKGTGINFKVGIIAKPTEWLRIGLGVQTPTYFGLNETFQSNMSATYKVSELNINGFIEQVGPKNTVSTTGQPSVYKYNLVTPVRASGGIALFLGKKGFISADLEYVPYNLMTLKENREYSTPGNSSFTTDNQSISNAYKAAVNVNVGGELRLDIYRIRLGYSRQGDPYNILGYSNNAYTASYSGGVGIRIDDYYVDFAIVNSRYNTTYVPYTLELQSSPVVNVKNVNTSVLISGGFYF